MRYCNTLYQTELVNSMVFKYYCDQILNIIKKEKFSIQKTFDLSIKNNIGKQELYSILAKISNTILVTEHFYFGYNDDYIVQIKLIQDNFKNNLTFELWAKDFTIAENYNTQIIELFKDYLFPYPLINITLYFMSSRQEVTKRNTSEIFGKQTQL